MIGVEAVGEQAQPRDQLVAGDLATEPEDQEECCQGAAQVEDGDRQGNRLEQLDADGQHPGPADRPIGRRQSGFLVALAGGDSECSADIPAGVGFRLDGQQDDDGEADQEAGTDAERHEVPMAEKVSDHEALIAACGLDSEAETRFQAKLVPERYRHRKRCDLCRPVAASGIAPLRIRALRCRAGRQEAGKLDRPYGQGRVRQVR